METTNIRLIPKEASLSDKRVLVYDPKPGVAPGYVDLADLIGSEADISISDENTWVISGVDTGVHATGDNGKSAYEIAAESGFTGSIEEWLASLKGRPGEKGDTGPAGRDGADGAPGTPGEDGMSMNVHIKYSDDGGQTLTANDGETVGDYLGQYTSFYSEASIDPKDYKWARIKGDNGEDGNYVVNGINEGDVFVMSPGTINIASREGSNPPAGYVEITQNIMTIMHEQEIVVASNTGVAVGYANAETLEPESVVFANNGGIQLTSTKPIVANESPLVTEATINDIVRIYHVPNAFIDVDADTNTVPKITWAMLQAAVEAAQKGYVFVSNNASFYGSQTFTSSDNLIIGKYYFISIIDEEQIRYRVQISATPTNISTQAIPLDYDAEIEDLKSKTWRRYTGNISTAGSVIAAPVGDTNLVLSLLYKDATHARLAMRTTSGTVTADVNRSSIPAGASEGTAFDGRVFTTTFTDIDDTMYQASNDLSLVRIRVGDDEYEAEAWVSGGGARATLKIRKV